MTEWTKAERSEEKNGVITVPGHKSYQFTTLVVKQNSNNASGLRKLLHIKNLFEGTAEMSMMRAIMSFLNIKEDKCGSYTDTWRKITYRAKQAEANNPDKARHRKSFMINTY
jgi:hypothetical protein